MKLSQFKFKLPEEKIALHPAKYRDESRLMVVHKSTGEIEHKMFKDILNYFDDGDVFIFGGGEEAVINSKTIWALYTTHSIDGRWRIEDTKGMTEFTFCDGSQVIKVEKPMKGTVIRRDFGIAIYMGDITYLSGNIRVKGK